MDAHLFFACVIGVVCGAIALAVVLLVAQSLTPKEETEKEHKPTKIENASKRAAKLLERAEIRGRIFSLSSMGYSQREIAKVLGMHQKSVWRIMKRYGIKKA